MTLCRLRKIIENLPGETIITVESEDVDGATNYIWTFTFSTGSTVLDEEVNK